MCIHALGCAYTLDLQPCLVSINMPSYVEVTGMVPLLCCTCGLQQFDCLVLLLLGQVNGSNKTKCWQP